MNSPVITINIDKGIIDATKLMAEYWIRRLPVVDQTGKVIGVLSLTIS